MLTGTTGALLGATKAAKRAYADLEVNPEYQSPLSWTSSTFTLADYDLVFLPGSHDKGVRQIIDSERVHNLLADYFPLSVASGPQ